MSSLRKRTLLLQESTWDTVPSDAPIPRLAVPRGCNKYVKDAYRGYRILEDLKTVTPNIFRKGRFLKDVCSTEMGEEKFNFNLIHFLLINKVD